jgi:hypothetical protein
MTSTKIETRSEAKAAGYVIIGEWGDHLHHYHEGYLYAPASAADEVRAMYDADEIRDDSTLADFYARTGCVWIGAGA